MILKTKGELNGFGARINKSFEHNPIRYRGYYYDADNGYYYLQSRYYDPNMGRFVNGDGYASQAVLTPF